jgi:hypothetical protein
MKLRFKRTYVEVRGKQSVENSSFLLRCSVLAYLHFI